MDRQADIRPLAAPEDPDAGLVEGLKRADPACFRLLLQRYQHPVYAYICRLIDDPVEAEDVTQDVFVKVFRKVEGFRGDCSFKTWLYRIAVNESSNRKRWFSRHRLRELAESVVHGYPEAFAEQIPHPGRSPFEQTESREQRNILNEALRALDPRYRQAVVLRDIAGLSYAEIAATLDISLGTVKSRILRGREALKRYLVRHAPTLVPVGAPLPTE